MVWLQFCFLTEVELLRFKDAASEFFLPQSLQRLLELHQPFEYF